MAARYSLREGMPYWCRTESQAPNGGRKGFGDQAEGGEDGQDARHEMGRATLAPFLLQRDKWGVKDKAHGRPKH